MQKNRDYLITLPGFESAIVTSLETERVSHLEILAKRGPLITNGKLLETWLDKNGHIYESFPLPKLCRSFREVHTLGPNFFKYLQEKGDLLFDEESITKYSCERCSMVHEDSPVLKLVIHNPDSKRMAKAEIDYFCSKCEDLVFGHIAYIENVKRLIEKKGESCVMRDSSGEFVKPTKELIDLELKKAYGEAREDGEDCADFLDSLSLAQATRWAAKIEYDITKQTKEIELTYQTARKRSLAKIKITG